MKWDAFFRIFAFALLGGLLYEFGIYLVEGSLPHWKNVIIPLVVIALIVSLVMMGVRKIFSQSESEP